MISEEKAPELGNDAESELKAIFYQYVKLYESWWHDRQDFVKNLADHTKLLNLFVEQISRFKELEGKVKQSLVKSVEESGRNIQEELGNTLHEVSVGRVNTVVKELQSATHEAVQVLATFQAQQRQDQWKTVGLTTITAILASVLSVWLWMPKPLLPLTGDMLSTYANGVFIQTIWPKLPKKMRKSISDISQKGFNKPSPLPVSDTQSSNNTTTNNNDI